jgi:hypothetical protein
MYGVGHGGAVAVFGHRSASDGRSLSFALGPVWERIGPALPSLRRRPCIVHERGLLARCDQTHQSSIDCVHPLPEVHC